MHLQCLFDFEIPAEVGRIGVAQLHADGKLTHPERENMSHLRQQPLLHCIFPQHQYHNNAITHNSTSPDADFDTLTTKTSPDAIISSNTIPEPLCVSFLPQLQRGSDDDDAANGPSSSSSRLIIGGKSPSLLQLSLEGATSSQHGQPTTIRREKSIHPYHTTIPNIRENPMAHHDWIRDIVPLEGFNLQDYNDSQFFATVSNDKIIKIWSCDDSPADDDELEMDATPHAGDFASASIRRNPFKLHFQWKGHHDYILTAKFAPHTGILHTAGSDGNILLWDLKRVQQSVGTVFTDSVHSHGDALIASQLRNEEPPYMSLARHCLVGVVRSTSADATINSLDVASAHSNSSERLLLSGCNDGIVRVFDTRNLRKPECIAALRGHKDNIRSVRFSSCGHYAYSGSSDGFIKKWDLRRRRCVSSFDLHSDSVMGLKLDDTALSHNLLSYGRDGKVFNLDTEKKEASLIVDRGPSDPIVCCALEKPSRRHLWIGTETGLHRYEYSEILDDSATFSIQSPTSGSFSWKNLSSPQWKKSTPNAKPVDDSNPISVSSQEGTNGSPDLHIPSRPRIVKYSILNDKRGILTMDNHNNVVYYDITKGGEQRNYGSSVDFDELLKEINPKQSLPSWFSVSLKLGRLEIIFDASQMFSTDAYIFDAGIEGLDKKSVRDSLTINFGEVFLRNVFGRWIEERIWMANGGEVEDVQMSDAEDGSMDEESEDSSKDDASRQEAPASRNAEMNQSAPTNDTNPVDETDDMQDDMSIDSVNDNSADPALKQHASLSKEKISKPQSQIHSPLVGRHMLPKNYDESSIHFEIDPDRTLFSIDFDRPHSTQQDANRPPFYFSINELSLCAKQYVEYTDIPDWIVEALLEKASIGTRKSAKLTLHLEPLDKSFQVPPYTLGSQHNLSGDRLTRIQTICEHLASKIDLPQRNPTGTAASVVNALFRRGSKEDSSGNSKKEQQEKSGRVSATEYIQIYASDDFEEPLPLDMTIAVAHQFHRSPKDGVFTLYYGKNSQWAQ